MGFSKGEPVPFTPWSAIKQRQSLFLSLFSPSLTEIDFSRLSGIIVMFPILVFIDRVQVCNVNIILIIRG